MQNNLADSQQHFEGVSVAVAKVFPPIAVSGLTLGRRTVARLANHGNNTLYVIQIIIALPKLKQSLVSGAKMNYLTIYVLLSCFSFPFC